MARVGSGYSLVSMIKAWLRRQSVDSSSFCLPDGLHDTLLWHHTIVSSPQLFRKCLKMELGPKFSEIFYLSDLMSELKVVLVFSSFIKFKDSGHRLITVSRLLQNNEQSKAV